MNIKLLIQLLQIILWKIKMINSIEFNLDNKDKNYLIYPFFNQLNALMLINIIIYTIKHLNFKYKGNFLNFSVYSIIKILI